MYAKLGMHDECLDLPEGVVEVELRGSSTCRDHVIFGGRNGNVVTKSSTPEVLKGWRLIWLNGKDIPADASQIQKALLAAKRQSRYIVRFSTEGQRLPKRRSLRVARAAQAPPRNRSIQAVSTVSELPQQAADPSEVIPAAVDAAGGDSGARSPAEDTFSTPGDSSVLVEGKSAEDACIPEAGFPGANASPLAACSSVKSIEFDLQCASAPPPPLVLLRASSLRCPSLVYGEIRFLAAGNYGSAFLVRRLRDGLHFVAKKCDISRMDAIRRQACLDEISLLRRISHPCIAEYVDFLWTNEDRECFWLVLKHYPGGDVQNRINDLRARKERLEPVRVQTWVTQLCMALEHVHALRIVHNDVKGNNMFITAADNIVLGDFGVSEELAPDSPSSNSKAGSPAFMAPERWNGGGGTFASDMWSTGIVAYELTALRRPFHAHSVASLVYKLSSEDPEPLAEDICAAELWQLITQLLNKQPEERPSAEEALQRPLLRNCAEMLQRMHQHLEDSADAVKRLKEQVEEAEKYMRRAMGQDSSSSESDCDDAPAEEDEVLTLRVSSSGNRVDISDSWGGAQVLDESVNSLATQEVCTDF
eukprot:TRINITY_DN30162_c0_g1_i1.p1 TRINITY_DN30162_c0_g1~~TRINITY_DN30162_c0_g1_i1.p1  ORF type:complete len:590 (-),score=126.47 TRINITY_DN30162_c0_g1_i1:255-2024(-)